MKTSISKISETAFHKALESRIRLGIMSALAVNETLDFKSLKEFLNITDGNLASNIRTLEKEKFVGVKKTFIGKKPNTKYYMTRQGKKAFNAHLDTLEQFIKSQK